MCHSIALTKETTIASCWLVNVLLMLLDHNTQTQTTILDKSFLLKLHTYPQCTSLRTVTTHQALFGPFTNEYIFVLLATFRKFFLYILGCLIEINYGYPSNKNPCRYSIHRYRWCFRLINLISLSSSSYCEDNHQVLFIQWSQSMYRIAITWRVITAGWGLRSHDLNRCNS